MTLKTLTFIPEGLDLDQPVMTGEELMDATSTVVRTISRDHNSNVVFAGGDALTDGKIVVLPSLPNDAKVTKRQALVCGGFANHETLHVLLTDFKKLTEFATKWKNEGLRLEPSMANAIEDIRIEMGGLQLYDGMGKAIDKTARPATSSTTSTRRTPKR